MNLTLRHGFTIIVRATILLVLIFLGFMLYVTFKSPYTKPSEKSKMRSCKQHMTNLLCVTSLFDTVQEAADNLRNWKDPWGHDYNAIVADEFALIRFGRISGGNIIIWSSGPNGVNENGRGDDIVAGNEPIKSEIDGNSHEINDEIME